MLSSHLMATIMASTTRISKESMLKSQAETVLPKENTMEEAWYNFLIMRMMLMMFLKKELTLVMNTKTILMISLNWLIQSIKIYFSLIFNHRITSTIQKIFLRAKLEIFKIYLKEELLKKEWIMKLLGQNGTKKVFNHSLLSKGKIIRKKIGTKPTKFQICHPLNTTNHNQMSPFSKLPTTTFLILMIPKILPILSTLQITILIIQNNGTILLNRKLLNLKMK